MSETVNVLGVSFNKITMKETVEIIESEIKSSRINPYHIVTGNPEIVLNYKEDKMLNNLINEADLITPDGIGIILASKWKRNSLPERVPGSDLLINILEKGSEEGWSFYFLGTDEDTNKKAVENIRAKYPKVIISGRHDGFFDKVKEENIIEEINKAKPDILVVALGAPRAEKWIYENKSRLNTKVAIGVGGMLDVIAGKVKRAPLIWQKMNLEWLYRLLRQPSRWRRQLALPLFAWKAFCEALSENSLKKN
ncbi:WecB/TagA/CpsF family glycosyltransferase [Clostridium swellfunianum]|uniref:WecB/TagA/CpsF family glycosyltransferase n=1 Tax=Clostridium swellfunianum TaxID=1367462 RepID=UPI00202F6ADA|nr:WecB/TagA/CpsF family glycosyltransferase [Clostridium swellfunianum]MCM0649271.1 WecB/TagA/CpsF family glycosyltransferase [Clostridium swellfunianum]